jgi:hypothetical protein
LFVLGHALAWWAERACSLLWMSVMVSKKVGEWERERPDKVTLPVTYGQPFRVVGPLVTCGVPLVIKREKYCMLQNGIVGVEQPIVISQRV